MSLDGDRLDWEPGQHGKGIIDSDGHVHTFDSEEYEVHHDYLADHPDIEADHYLYIEPDGGVSTAWSTLNPHHEELLREADPRLYVLPHEFNV